MNLVLNVWGFEPCKSSQYVHVSISTEGKIANDLYEKNDPLDFILFDRSWMGTVPEWTGVFLVNINYKDGYTKICYHLTTTSELLSDQDDCFRTGGSLWCPADYIIMSIII